MAVVIMGMHRSGTSAFAGLLSRMGLYFGEGNEMVPAHPDNPSGYMERNDILTLNDAILATGGGRWNAPLAFQPDRIPDARRDEWIGEARRVVERLDAHAPWFVKDPRFCLTLPLWRPLLRDALCLIVVRNPLQIARSLLCRGDGDIRSALALWECYTCSALSVTRGMPRRLLYYEELIQSPVRCAENLSRIVAGAHKPAEDRVREWMQEDLFHQRDDDEAFAEQATVSQRVLYQSLADGSALDQRTDPTPSEEAVKIMEIYEQVVAARDRRYEDCRAALKECRRESANRRKRFDDHLEIVDINLQTLVRSRTWRFARWLVALIETGAFRARGVSPAETIRNELDRVKRDMGGADDASDRAP